MPVKPDVKTSGPWRGMRYAFDPEKPAPQDLLYWAQNMMPLTRPGPYVRRKRDRYYDVGPNNSFSRWVHTWHKPDGTRRLLVGIVDNTLANFAVYELAAVGGTLVASLVLNAATLAAAGVGLAGPPVDYLDKLVFPGDPGNPTFKPFLWDGTLNGGITVLANCSNGAFSPAIYYGKVFFIKGATLAAQNTLIWSEENDATTGYEAGGFLNAWTLTQQSQDPLTALRATNEALYYFRTWSIGTIRGAVTPDFAASGVHDNVSTEFGSGTGIPALINSRLWFADRGGRPWMRAVGGEMVPIWQQAALLWPSTRDGQASSSVLGWAYVEEFNAVVFASNLVSLAFNADDGALLAVWSWTQTPHFLTTVMSPVWITNVPAVVVDGTAGTPVRVGLYGDGDFPASDYAAEVPAQTYRLLTHPLGGLDGSLRHWTELDIEFWLDGNATESPDNVPAVVSAAETVYQQGLADPLATLAVQQLGHAVQSRSQRRVWGLNRELRWAQAGVAATVALALKGWGVNRVTLKGVAIPIPPSRS